MGSAIKEPEFVDPSMRTYHTSNVAPEERFVKPPSGVDWVERRRSMGFRTRTNPEPLRNKIGTGLTDQEFEEVQKLGWAEHQSVAGMGRVLILEALAARGIYVESNTPQTPGAKRRR